MMRQNDRCLRSKMSLLDHIPRHTEADLSDRPWPSSVRGLQNSLSSFLEAQQTHGRTSHLATLQSR